MSIARSALGAVAASAMAFRAAHTGSIFPVDARDDAPAKLEMKAGFPPRATSQCPAAPQTLGAIMDDVPDGASVPAEAETAVAVTKRG
jgi:hypothetical protein